MKEPTVDQLLSALHALQRIHEVIELPYDGPRIVDRLGASEALVGRGFITEKAQRVGPQPQSTGLLWVQL